MSSDTDSQTKVLNPNTTIPNEKVLSRHESWIDAKTTLSRLCRQLRLSTPCFQLIQPFRPSATMSLDSSYELSEDELDSCRDDSRTMATWFPVSSSSTFVPFSPAAYHLDLLSLDQAKLDYVSHARRLSAYYANAAYDFYGTPSAALCVYKNGDAWPVRTGPEAWRTIREARGVHGHPMQAVWSELGERVCALLDDKQVRWTSIDVVSFAEAGDKPFSLPLIWIGVEPESLAYELANTAAEAVHFLITEAGFSDFEVGFRESVVTRSVIGPKLLSFDPIKDSVPEFRKPFTPALGLSIASFKTPHFEGTGALYLRESKDSKRVFLLTCAHVARPLSIYHNKGLARKTKNHPRERIVVLGYSGYDSVLTHRTCAIGNLDSSIRAWQAVLRRLGEPKEGEDESIKRQRDEHLARVERARREIDEIAQFRSEVTRPWSIPDRRVIGEVVHVEPIEANVAPNRFSTDWALIELYDKKFDWDTFPGNKVYIGGNLPLVDYCWRMFPQPENEAKYEYPLDGLQALGDIQLEEIRNPQQLDANGEPCLPVVKNGLATGTTIGRVTGMESFFRIYNEHGIEETSRALAVLPYNNKAGPFSAPGDSGSIVLDRDGRILGMITAGAGTAPLIDVTYVTPYWHIEQEIKKHFPESLLYEVVK
ncbi:uncharacterized protein L203_101268 [Cryptococcus depauperatus CBS 7841]|uniref:Peptidase S7 domain-containing protein n=1 Tax=Cryptococcus depauperatus CBS 7841 TaxID=1295531 RepID=A0AAJ8JPM7_9TREE